MMKNSIYRILLKLIGCVISVYVISHSVTCYAFNYGSSDICPYENPAPGETEPILVNNYSDSCENRIKRLDLQTLSVDSIHIGLGEVAEIKFKGDSNIVFTYWWDGRTYTEKLSDEAHNIILNCIDSLYISKTVKAVISKVRHKRLRFATEWYYMGPEIIIYRNGKATKFQDFSDSLDGTGATLFSEPFFRLNCFLDEIRLLGPSDRHKYKTAIDELRNRLRSKHFSDDDAEILINRLMNTTTNKSNL